MSSSGEVRESARPTFAVVIPMFNEENGARLCLDSVFGALAKFKDRACLIVVDDGSADKTWEILEGEKSKHGHLVTLRHLANRGYGAALATGVAAAADRGMDYVLFMDSDLTNDPADIPRFYTFMIQGYDVIKATRFSKGGGMKGVPFRRAIFSIAGNALARVLFRNGLTDCTNGFRAIRTSLLVNLARTERGFASIVEELCNLKSIARRYAEVPVVLTSRTVDLRGTAFTYDLEQIARYLKYAVKACVESKPR